MSCTSIFSFQAKPSAAAIERQKKKEKAMNKKAVHSKSFAQNMFRLVKTRRSQKYLINQSITITLIRIKHCEMDE